MAATHPAHPIINLSASVMYSSLRKLFILGATAWPFHHLQAQTTVTAGSLAVIHGPADLDLKGEFVHAINFSANDPALTVDGITFTPDTAPPAGATFVGPNNVTPWQVRPEFGDTPNENNLERIYEDIRWANTGASEQLEAHLPVTPGQTYKLQVLFYGNVSENRWWDIGVEGVMSVDGVSSLGESPDGVSPEYDSSAGMVFSQTFTATDSSLDVVFGQIDGLPSGGDQNPIWQGMTLEHIVPDTDGDGLPDAWEMATFGNLLQTATGDADSDGIPNYIELNFGTNANADDTDGDGLKDGLEFNVLGTNPKLADTDGDGLSDGAEVNTHHTNPLAADTDLDGLNDNEEINTYSTNPLVTDSDNDDYPDGVEVAKGTDPANAASFPLLSSFARALTGGDAGEGLDLTGNFKYAFNVGTNGAPGLIRGLNFTDDTNDGAGGITISPGAEIAAWEGVPYLGDSADDMNLSTLLWSIRHAGALPGTITVNLTGLTAGKPYKLQLLFMERCCNRAFDILVDGQLKLDDFAPVALQDGIAAPTRGSVAVIGFLATGTSAEIVLDGTTVTTVAYTDHNPILNGLTLEELAGGDLDGDGMEDLWETENFGDLSQTGTGDFDMDGLTNAQEYTAGTNPKVVDTDGDGLTDAAEVNTHHSNPLKADSDGDGLSDPFEILTSLSSPTNADTDGDGYGDAIEYSSGTSLTNAASYPLFGVLVSSFSGGDPGEGLDMTGTFLHAFNIGTPGAAPGPVGDVNFLSDLEDGIVVNAVYDAPDWAAAQYGATANDDNLEFVMHSIRWSAAPDVPTVDLSGLTVGSFYKLQLLFAEQTSDVRGFDIQMQGVGRLHEFVTSVPQGGVGNAARGSVVTIGFKATSDTLSLALTGNVVSPTVTDRNPILNALTLETLTLPDTDSDGLPDVWELQFFGDLTKTAAADSDGDGVINSAELAAGTNPNAADTDGDGLKDGQEATGGTNPFFVDTDADGLSDSVEVLTVHSDPLVEDTDMDGFGDGVEYLSGSNPLALASVPSILIDAFTGGDPGEGLDLQGNFLYAFNIGTNPISGQAGDAVFTADNVPGISIVAANQIPNWATSSFGDSAADNVLEIAMNSIRWQNAPNNVRVSLAGLTPGNRYKTQLLFSEPGTNRGFDVCMEGLVIVDDFVPGAIQGNTNTQGTVISWEFTAPDSELNLILNGRMFPAAADQNPTISGMTLEALSAATPGDGPVIASAIFTPAGVTLTLQGTPGKTYALDYSPSLTAGTWVEVNDNAVVGAGGTATVTDSNAAHLTPGKGYWRFRDPVLKPLP